MFRSFLLGGLGVMIFCSLHGTVASHSPYSVNSFQSADNTTGTHQKVASEFVPDTLARGEDDAEEEPTEKSVKGNIAIEVSSSKNKPRPVRPQHSKQAKVRKSVSGQRRLLKHTGQNMDVTQMSTRAMNNRLVTSTGTPRGEPTSHSPWPFSSSPLAATKGVKGVAAERKSKETSPANEDENLKLTTSKLVKWLRNRLRKRLEEVADLEEKCDVEKKLLVHLNETIEAKVSERQAEIKMKIQAQNELKNVRRNFTEPDRELHEIRAENSNLVDQLSHLKRTYNDLADTRKDMEDKLVSAGFTHWLDKRGKEYMPATAVGVLSKSARILDPVSRGLEEVVKLDEFFSSGVERVIPISERTLISKLLCDLALLLPVIPVIMLLWRISFVSQRLSLLHIIMYISGIFAVESGLIFGLSLSIGGEAIKELQKYYELFVVTGVFVDVLLFSVMILMQTIVTILETSKSEVTQSLLSLAVGYHFFRTVFQPVVVSQPPATTTAAHLLYATNFTLIALEKKTKLKVGTRFDRRLNSYLLSIERWFCETWQAMKDLFVDTLPDMSDDDTTSIDSHSLCSHNELLREVEPFEEPAPNLKKPDVEEVAKALDASRGYAKWTAARMSRNSTPGRPPFRGIRWYQTNPQSTLLQSGSRRRVRQEHIRSETDIEKQFSSRKN